MLGYNHNRQKHERMLTTNSQGKSYYIQFPHDKKMRPFISTSLQSR